ncbi:hypothetical protein Aca07nite_64410 [Actinoplanes capillaceus]|uniref:Uncharacterized protein n=1 Tax=Actinoplanes campanulatus TaxID=113559 RepID=A0ABQ3WSL7_9ACTN|nr:hypothetical protein Aca07nite_64410 [Actinoplanes capillaceus]
MSDGSDREPGTRARLAGTPPAQHNSGDHDRGVNGGEHAKDRGPGPLNRCGDLLAMLAMLTMATVLPGGLRAGVFVTGGAVSIRVLVTGDAMGAGIGVTGMQLCCGVGVAGTVVVAGLDG